MDSRSLATVDNYHLPRKNASFRFVIWRVYLWGGRFQMAVVGERQVTGGMVGILQALQAGDALIMRMRSAILTIAYSIYFKGVCGGNDFSRARLKEDGFSAGKAGNYGVEKNRYGMDNKIPSKPLKVRSYSRTLPIYCLLEFSRR